MIYNEAAAECASISDVPSICETKKVFTKIIGDLSTVDSIYSFNDSKTIT